MIEVTCMGTLDILSFVAKNGIDNPVWVTTDVHFAEAFRYTPFPEEHPDFLVHELATGPLNAGIFPNRAFDPTLNLEVLFFHGPATPADVTNWIRPSAGSTSARWRWAPMAI